MHCFQKEYKHTVHRKFQTQMNTEDIEAIEVDSTSEKLETVAETIDNFYESLNSNLFKWLFLDGFKR